MRLTTVHLWERNLVNDRTALLQSLLSALVLLRFDEQIRMELQSTKFERKAQLSQ